MVKWQSYLCSLRLPQLSLGFYEGKLAQHLFLIAQAASSLQPITFLAISRSYFCYLSLCCAFYVYGQTFCTDFGQVGQTQEAYISEIKLTSTFLPQFFANLMRFPLPKPYLLSQRFNKSHNGALLLMARHGGMGVGWTLWGAIITDKTTCVSRAYNFSADNSMNFFNLREVQSSQDEHFLQNLRGNNDLFQQFCKVQSHSDRQPSENQVKQQMEDEMQYHVKRGSKDSKGNRRSKDKKKVFYRDKMAELMKPGEYVKQQYKYVTYTTGDHNKLPISKQEQLKRNRESAKNSRQRKKEYVTFLEMKNDEHAKTIGELTYKLQQVTLQRDRLKQDHHAQIKTFCKSKAEAYESLELALKQNQGTQDNIKALINDMMARFGTSGSERIGIINYYMNEIIEVLVSDIHKYFLTSSSFVQKTPPNSPPKNIDVDVMRILRLDSAKLNTMVSKYRQRFVKETTVFKDLTQELYRIFKSIQSQGKVIEVVFAEMVKQIDPKALGELIVWFEENRFCREIKRVRREWVDQLKAGEEVIEVIRKQTKQDHF